jgi:putative ABC transport system permease protein
MQIEDEYFEALDIPVLRGRSFAAADLEEGSNVVAVNQSFVERYWPKGEDPLGRRVRNGWEPPADGEPAPWLTIVGVVADVRHQGFDDPPRPELYVPYSNAPGRGMTVVIETASDPAALAALARETVSKIDADQPVYNARTVDEIVEREAAGFRAIAQILGTVGFGALALAAVGIYGVITWSMSQRRQEIGIRRAVGASGRDIVWLTVRQGLTPVAIGLVIGTGLSVGFAFMLRGLMFSIAPAAPGNYVMPAAGLLVVAMVASLVPAMRATRLDPLVVLRHE